ncbi:helix-turn-helix domain-containing protein [uncultured Ornithinimicrobium sp.]|uniref:helix-turn-helix domain-containing protein n=1 Tax=uncultured Ornithinimicrobium sp. TaxID=259307 RepID=UPI00259A172A|nr:helix-turn-helix domain-containing protein [uncultured Ornithinimicrobium sp.]
MTDDPSSAPAAGPASGTVRLTSPMLKAMAHPLRRRLLELMHEDVPRRAADLAELVDAPANSVSFHLRQLAKAGLIVEAPEHARDRRDRVWVASGSGFTVGPPEGPVTADEELVLRSFMDQEALDLHDLVARITAWAAGWGSGREESVRAAIHTGLVELTEEDVRWLSGELEALMDRAIERSRTPTEQPKKLWRMVSLVADDSLPRPTHPDHGEAP